MSRVWKIVLYMGVWSLPPLLTVASSQALAAVEGTPPRRALLVDLFAFQLPLWWIWALLSPVVYRVCDRVRPGAEDPVRLLAVHLGLAAGLVGVHNLVFVGALRTGGVLPPEAGFGQVYAVMLSQTVALHLVIYAGVAGVSTGIHVLREASARELRESQLEAQLSRARLEALRMQLHPHFLFNALNAVAMRVRRGAREQALELLVGFSELLRLILQHEEPMLPLEEELEFTRRYLEIEAARLGSRFSYKVEGDPAAGGTNVPTLLLQPLLENAIRHGAARVDDDVTVTVRVRRLEGRLRIRITNSPAPDGEIQSPPEGDGIGLSNTRARLREAFGDDASLEIERSDRQVRVEMDLPCPSPASRETPEPGTQKAPAPGDGV